MDPAVNSSETSQSDSKEISQPGSEEAKEAVAPRNRDTEQPVDSHSDKTDAVSQDESAGKCDEGEQSSQAADAVTISGPVASSKSSEEKESVTRLTETTQNESSTVINEKLQNEVSTQEAIQESIFQEDTIDDRQQTVIVSSETSMVQQLSDSITEELSKFSSELISTQIIKQTMTSSSQETTISKDSLTIDTNLKVTENENLLDPEKVSELRSSPYYDSLIANRISLENQFSKPAQKKEEQNLQESDSALEEQLDDESPITADDHHPSEKAADEGQPLSKEDKAEIEEQGAMSSASQSDFASKTVSSLKDACQEVVKASSQVNHAKTATSGMFKVTKFEAKSFSEVKTSSEWSYEQSSLFKSGGDSLVSSQQVSESTDLSEIQDAFLNLRDSIIQLLKNEPQQLNDGIFQHSAE